MSVSETTSTTLQSAIDSAYQPSAGHFDEFCAAAGKPREHWHYLISALNSLSSAELSARGAEIRRLLRENGVTYSLSADTRQPARPWQLDLVPHLIASDEWREIERGLQQRAELMNLILTDLYGPRELLRKNLLPPELIFSQNAFLPQCSDIEPGPDKRFLSLYAADLSRAPDGSLVVLQDRVRAPLGVGYALENRMVLSRVLPSVFRDSNVHRLALFFRALRSRLAELAWRPHDEQRIVMLSPGPRSEGYFEHAYLAKYLGYTLVEGADLTVRDGRAWLKTLDGLQPVDVILRWINDSSCDPLELNASSHLGSAGLLQAVRLRNLTVVNPIGCSIAENQALHAYLPKLAKHFLGEPLLLPSPQTYWCGLAQERDHVLANLDRLLIHETSRAERIHPATLSAEQLKQLRQNILANPNHYVGQDDCPCSTTPVLLDNTLQARSFVLRTFLVSSQNDYTVLPGGLTRVATAPDDPVEAVQYGGISKDTWVLASEPVRQVSLLSSQDSGLYTLGDRGELPSRVAESLFWLGRYAERADSVIRLLRAVFLNLLQTDSDQNVDSNCLHYLLQAVTQLTETYPGFVGDGAAERLANPDQELLSIFLDKTRSGSLAHTLQGLLYSVSTLRDRISPDIWRVFNDIDEGLQEIQQQRSKPGLSTTDSEMLNTALDELNRLVTNFAAFSGLAMDSMTHGQGWRFLMIGRRLERAQQLAHLLRATVVNVTEHDSALLEYILLICDSLMTYRRRYRSAVNTQAALDILLLDEANPRAMSYQLRHLEADLLQIPSDTTGSSYQHRRDSRLALQALTCVRLAQTDQLASASDGERVQLAALLDELDHILPELSNTLTGTYFILTEQRQLGRLEQDQREQG